MLYDPDRIKSVPVHDPLALVAYSSSPENVAATIVNGKTVYRKDSFLCGIEEASLAHEVREVLKKAGYAPH